MRTKTFLEENKQIKKQLEDIKFRNLTHELDF